MNILHIITHYDPIIYGAENFAKHVAEYQVKQGHTVWVVTGKWKEDWQDTETIQGVRVIRVKCIKIRYIQTLLATIPLYTIALNLIKKHSIDWVHAHIYPGMLVGYLLKLQAGIPFISTIQGGDIGDYDEVFGPFKSVARSIIGFCLKRADTVHCVSNYLAEEVKKMGINNRDIVVLPNGVDVHKFKMQDVRLEIKGKSIKLISTSRLEKKNNLAILIELIAELIQKSYEVTLDIYGKGSLEQELEKRITDLKLRDVVSLKGYVNQNQLSKLLPNYDLFIRLSTQEGFGISFLEAMACGVVPIGTPVGGIVDIIDDGKNGYLINLQETPETKLTQIFRNQNTWKTVSNNARKKVENIFDWKKILPKVANLYQ